MNVLFAIPAFLPAASYGGPIRKLATLLPGLQAAGIRSMVVASTLDDQCNPVLPTGHDCVDSINVFRQATIWHRRWSPWIHWQDPGFDPDVIHIIGTWNGVSYSAMMAATRMSVPWVWEPAGMLTRHGRHPVARLAGRVPHAVAAAWSAGLIWTSPVEQSEAAIRPHCSWIRPNIAPVPPEPGTPLDPDVERKLQPGDRSPVWGYLGRIAHRKGIPQMLDAWTSADGPGRLVFAGPVEDQHLADAIDRTDGVIRIPPLDAQQRWAYLRRLDALVLMPEWGENFGNVVAEAVAVGTPCVCSAAVGATHWLDGNGAVVETVDGLRRRFHLGLAPEEDCRIPSDLTTASVVATQVDIYQQATV